MYQLYLREVTEIDDLKYFGFHHEIFQKLT